MKSTHAIPSEKIIDRLRFENLWGKSNRIRDMLAEWPRRLYFSLLLLKK